MNPFEHPSEDDANLSKLESHIKQLPPSKAPEAWKKDILTHAQSALEEKPLKTDLFHVCKSLIQSALTCITPPRATIAAIWLLAFCGNKFDAWLNGSSAPASEWSPTPNTYITLTTQLEQWDLAGLESDYLQPKPNQTIPNKEHKPETTPGPRSHWNQKKSLRFTL